MAEYIAIHKCRLCGEIIEGAHANKMYAIKSMFGITINGKPDVPQAPWLIEYHECKNGDIGITDFQGFKKVEDE